MDADPNEAFDRYSEFLVDLDSSNPYDVAEDNEEAATMPMEQIDHGKVILGT